MNTVVEKYRNRFVKENRLSIKKIYVSEEESQKIKKINARTLHTEEESKILNEHKYDDVGIYKEEQSDEVISDSELNQFISMKMFDMTESMVKNQDTIKNIMIFWLVLTIMSLIGMIYISVKIGEVFGRLGGY